MAIYLAANVGFYLIRSYLAYRAELQDVSQDIVERIRDGYDGLLSATIRTILVATEQESAFRDALLDFDGSYADRISLLRGLSNIQAAVDPAQSVYAVLAPGGTVFSLETGGFSAPGEFYDPRAIDIMNRAGGVVVRHDRPLTFYGVDRSYTSVAIQVSSPVARAAILVNLSENELERALLESAPGAADHSLSIVGADEYAADPPASQAVRATAASDSFGRQFVLEVGSSGISSVLSATASFAGISLAAAAVLFGGFILLIVRSLKPLDRLLARVQPGDAGGGGADIGELEQYLTRLMTDNERLQREYRRLIPESRKELLRDLFTGHTTRGPQLEERLRFNGIEEPQSGLVAACLLYDIQDLPEQRRIEASAVIESLLTDRIDRALQGFHVLIGRNQYGLAVPAAATVLELEEAFVRLITDAPELIRPRIAVGVGHPTEGFRGLVDSYDKAQAALEYRRTLDRQVVFASTVESLKGHRYRYPYERERLLIERLQSGDETGGLEVMNEILDQIVAEKLGDREIEYIRLQLIHALSRYLYEQERVYEEYDTSHARSIDEVRSILTNIVLRIVAAQKQHRASTRGELVERFVAYIEANSAHRSLQLLDLEEQFGLNRYYIGQLISEHTGKNFNTHLNEARVARAAEILEEEPGVTVKEVALRVGYTYPYYFIRQFKRIHGVTPKVYQESALHR